MNDAQIARDAARLDQTFARLRDLNPTFTAHLDPQSLWVVTKMIQIGITHPAVPKEVADLGCRLGEMFGSGLAAMAPEIHDLIEQFPISHTCGEDNDG